ncbi:hypothetical protein D1007_09125 [Hordeum vulgare]|nr:hypothetical protein D1007_09125 [Hordeum vulgare]
MQQYREFCTEVQEDDNPKHTGHTRRYQEVSQEERFLRFYSCLWRQDCSPSRRRPKRPVYCVSSFSLLNAHDDCMSFNEERVEGFGYPTSRSDVYKGDWWCTCKKEKVFTS